jgi:hypothetical protein
MAVNEVFLREITSRLCEGFSQEIELNLYRCLLSEREYQELKWNKKTTFTSGVHSHLGFMTFIERYVRLGIDIVSVGSEPRASIEASHVLRKVIGLAVASMEQNDEEIDVEDCWDDLVEIEVDNIVESFICIRSVLGDAVTSFVELELQKHDLFYNMHQIFVMGSLALIKMEYMPVRD